MQIFSQCSSKLNISNPVSFCPSSSILLDIETTGLSPEVSSVFMIGCGYFKDKHFHTIHWLADNLELRGEQEILEAFSHWLDAYSNDTDNLQIFTYNGMNFDIPFLEKRLEQCSLSIPSFVTFKNTTDLYRLACKYKTFWPVSNLKLKTLSEWLGYSYSEAPSGRKLIKTYHSYIKEKDPGLLNLLFLHNIDDLEALTYALSILHFFEFFNGSYEIKSVYPTDEHKIVFHLHSKYILPKRIEHKHDEFELVFQDQDVTLYVPLYPQGLRYYYKDCKNYIYLPSEGYALHKSMSKYIDKSNWIKATPETCYTWFLPDSSFYNDIKKQMNYVQMVFYLFGFL